MLEKFFPQAEEWLKLTYKQLKILTHYVTHTHF